MKKLFIALLLLINLCPLKSMDLATPAATAQFGAHPILQALAANEKLTCWQMERYIECRVKELGVKGIVERKSNQIVYALIYPLPWPMCNRGSHFFQIETNDLYTPQDKDVFSPLKCFNYDGELIQASPIDAVVSFIKKIRGLKKSPGWAKEQPPEWAKKTVVKEWRQNHQREFLKSLAKPQRREIKKLKSNLAQYAACFLYELRQKRKQLVAHAETK